MDPQRHSDVIAHFRIGVDPDCMNFEKLEHSPRDMFATMLIGFFHCNDHDRITKLDERIERCARRAKAIGDQQGDCAWLSFAPSDGSHAACL